MRTPSSLLTSLALTALLMTGGAEAVHLSLVGGNWLESVGATDVTDGAGSDLPTAIESSAAVALLSINNTAGLGWTLLVQRSGANLPAGVTLAVRRIPSGSCGAIGGGLSYLALSDQSQALFSGSGDCGDIPIQLRLQGVSIQQPPGLYGATVLYSVQ